MGCKCKSQYWQVKGENKSDPPKWNPISPSIALSVVLFFFSLSLLDVAVLSSFSPGDDEGRTTVTRREMKSQGRGGENKINRSSETKGHLLAANDKLSSKHER